MIAHSKSYTLVPHEFNTLFWCLLLQVSFIGCPGYGDLPADVLISYDSMFYYYKNWFVNIVTCESMEFTFSLRQTCKLGSYFCLLIILSNCRRKHLNPNLILEALLLAKWANQLLLSLA